MSNLVGVGREAEDRAADYLLGLGYTIVTRRYKVRGGEIDIIALDGETLVFVEVKYRRSASRSPEESLSITKREAISRAISIYLSDMEESKREVRFDLIAIDPRGLRHHKDLFRP